MALIILAGVPPLNGQSAVPRPAGAERLLQEFPAVWYEEYWSRLEVSPDSRTILYTSPFTNRIGLLDLALLGDLKPLSWAGLTDIRGATLSHAGALAVLGRNAGEWGWFRKAHGKLLRLPLPSDAQALAWSADGKQVAFARVGVSDSIFAGRVGRPTGYAVGGAVTGLEWLPSSDAILALCLDENGVSNLTRIELAGGRTHTIAQNLDASSFTSTVPVTLDGLRAYVALAGPSAPDPEARHRPHALRQLGIYEVDLATGNLRPVVPPAPGVDAYAPSLAGGHLYWIQATTQSSIVVVPIAGGEARAVARDGMVPSWRPDGRQIGFVSGEWRGADFGLNWDGAAVGVDTSGHPSDAPRPMIVGHDEDFQPVWSPHGRWIAYHSHRPTSRSATDARPGQSDDIWLRGVGGPPRDTAEIRVTDFGIESNSPDWSRDGTRLIFTSWAEDGPPGVSYPHVVTIDTLTGHAVRHERLPLPQEIQNAAWVAYSPVSDEVALEEDLGGGRHALWIVASTGVSARKVIEYSLGTSGGVSWTPDGRSLVYASLASGHMQLFAVSTTGGAPRQLTNDVANVFTPRVSPDGRFIAATRILHRKEIWRIRLPK